MAGALVGSCFPKPDTGYSLFDQPVKLMEATEKYIPTSGVIDQKFMEKFGYRDEGFNAAMNTDPRISLPLIIERFFSDGQYEITNKKHVEEPTCNWMLSYWGMELDMRIISKDKKLGANARVSMLPVYSSISDNPEMAFFKSLKIGKICGPDIVSSILVQEPDVVVSFTGIGWSYRDGHFIVKTDGIKRCLYVPQFTEGANETVMERGTVKELFRRPSTETKTPVTDTVAAYMAEVLGIK